MALQLLLDIQTLCGFLKLPGVDSNEDPSKWRARFCESVSGRVCVSRLVSVLLLNVDGDMVMMVVVILVPLHTAKDAAFTAFFSCVQATLGVQEKKRTVKHLHVHLSMPLTKYFSDKCRKF